MKIIIKHIEDDDLVEDLEPSEIVPAVGDLIQTMTTGYRFEVIGRRLRQYDGKFLEVVLTVREM